MVLLINTKQLLMAKPYDPMCQNMVIHFAQILGANLPDEVTLQGLT
jgi:hypothetical protein